MIVIEAKTDQSVGSRDATDFALPMSIRFWTVAPSRQNYGQENLGSIPLVPIR